MKNKIAYVFAERKPTLGINWIVIYYLKGISAQNPDDAARKLRQLRKEGYVIIDAEVPLERLVQSAYKYRDIDTKDKERLAYWDREWEHRENYPGLFREELEKLNTLQQIGVRKGMLWVSDVSLYPSGQLEYLREQMGEPFAPRTTYYLAADAEPRVAGRIDLDQFITLTSYFAKILSLRNSTENEAREFSSLGRPVADGELEQLIAHGIDVERCSESPAAKPC